jgi:hypothetical protein
MSSRIIGRSSAYSKLSCSAVMISSSLEFSSTSLHSSVEELDETSWKLAGGTENVGRVGGVGGVGRVGEVGAGYQ